MSAGAYTFLRRLTVVRAVSITPRMRRVTLGGEQLGGFGQDGASHPPFRSENADDFVRLVPAALPQLRYGTLEWTGGAIYRPYTVRRFDPDAAELDIDVVLHGDGVAADWARDAMPGDVMHITGPRSSRPTPQADCYLLAGDETALPAIGRWLEERNPEAEVLVLVEVANRSEEQSLDAAVTWLHRDGGPAGTDRLLEAVRDLGWPKGHVHAWAAGETNLMRRLRRHLREHRGLPRDMVYVKGYWSRS